MAALASPAHAPTLFIADDDYGPTRAGAVLRVDPGVAPRPFVSGAFVDPEGVLASGHSLFVADRGAPAGRDGRVLRVDLATGAVRTLVAGLSDPRGLAVSGGRLYVSDRCRRAIFVVDPRTGRHRTLTSGGLLTRPIGVARAARGRLYVADYGSSSVVAVSVSGQQRRLARGGRLTTPMGVAVLGRRTFVIDSNGEGAGEVLELRPGAQRRVAEVDNPEGITSAGGRLLVADDRSEAERVLSINPDTGALTVVVEQAGVLADPEALTLGPRPGVAVAQPVAPSGVPAAAKIPAHCGPLR